MIITGDTHGLLDIEKLKIYSQTHNTKEEYIVILGDVGVCFNGGIKDERVREELERIPSKGVLFIDGNHENFEILNSYEVEEWNGGNSIDKQLRIEGTNRRRDDTRANKKL